MDKINSYDLQRYKHNNFSLITNVQFYSVTDGISIHRCL